MNPCTKQIILLTIGLLYPIATAQITGRVVDRDKNPVPGTVIYDITGKKFEILNNETILTEHLTRAICDNKGFFTLKSNPEQPLLVARDLEGNFSLFPCEQKPAEPLTYIFKRPALLTGKVMEGPFPKADTEITVVNQEYPRNFSYTFKTKTNKAGEFKIENILPGPYVILVIEDVPTLGCVTGVVTKQKSITLSPDETKHVQLGGHDLPSLTGTVTTADNKPLHGVWVKLNPEQLIPDFETSVWADVTDPNGHYSIYDIPSGRYNLRCVRRLAKNTPTRVLKKNILIQIQDKDFNNNEDIQIDTDPFMPLTIGQAAPDIESQTIDGNKWLLKQHRGKIVVVHFYTRKCKFCRPNFSGFEKAYTTLQPDVEVLGISIDKTLAECQSFINELSVTHPQIFAGTTSVIPNQYRVSDVPTSFIIDKEGNIAQIDLFGETLVKFIKDAGL